MFFCFLVVRGRSTSFSVPSLDLPLGSTGRETRRTVWPEVRSTGAIRCEHRWTGCQFRREIGGPSWTPVSIRRFRPNGPILGCLPDRARIDGGRSHDHWRSNYRNHNDRVCRLTDGLRESVDSILWRGGWGVRRGDWKDREETIGHRVFLEVVGGSVNNSVVGLKIGRSGCRLFLTWLEHPK